MNSGHHKTIFSKRLGCLVAVGEHASSQGKANGAASGQFLGFAGTDWLSTILQFVGVLSASCALVTFAWAGPVATTALPTGGQVAQGAAAISQSGAVMNITQSTPKAVVNWNTFDIGQNAKVNIVQPGADAVMLNRVTSANPSQILGQLNANGQVVLVNPNGVLFGKDGSVNASSFTASTLGITDANFMAGNQQFERNGSTATVVNQGSIKTTGGYVALLGASVSNEGQIQTQGGTAYLAAAETVKIPVSGSGRIKLELSPSRINAAVANGKTGTIVTEGGQVYMQAASLSTMVASIIQSGNIDTTGEQGGAVHLLADGGQIKVDGGVTANSTAAGNKGGDIIIGRDEVTGVLAKSTDVSGAQLESKGGFVETSGDELTFDGVSVVAKDWLLDPQNITIDGTNNATIGANLGTTSITLQTTGTSLGTASAGTGMITISNAITKAVAVGTPATTLTLIADNGINVNASIGTAAGAGKLNVIMTASGNTDAVAVGSMIPAQRAASQGIFINNTSINANGGDVTLTGTSYANVTHPTNGLGKGVQIHNGSSITARNINITGTAENQSGNTSYGVVFQRYGTQATLTATGDITISGTVGGAGIGSGFYSAASGWGAQAPMITAGGKFTLTGTNSNTSNTSAAIDNQAGMQVRAVGDITVKANTNNAAVYAINFSSGSAATWGGALSGNTSFRSINGLGAASGNVLIQSNQGSISFNNALPSNLTSGSLTSLTDITGKNVVIDNTGGNVASGLLTASGGGASTGIGVNFADARAITATGQVFVNGKSTAASGVVMSGATITETDAAGSVFITGGSGVGTVSGVQMGSGSITSAGDISVTGTNSTGGATTAPINFASTINGASGKTINFIGGVSGAGSIVTNGAAVKFTNATATSQNYSGVISNGTGTGTGTVENLSGNQILSGNNTYTGSTNVTAGTLQIGNGGTTGTLGTGAVILASGATLGFKRSDSLFVSNTISGAGGITQSGTGAVFLNAGGTVNVLNTQGNSIASSLSTLTTGSSNLLKFGDSNWPNDLVSGGTFTLPTTTVAKGRSIVIWHNAGYTLNIATTNTNMASALNLAGYVDKGAVFTFDGTQWQYRGLTGNPGQLITNATANSYTGPTSVQAGRLDFLGGGLSGAYTAGSALTVASGASMVVGGGLSTTYSNLSGGGNIAGYGTGSALSIKETSDTLYSGVLSGDVKLTKTDTAKLTLSGNNTYTGGTNVDGGTLQIGNGTNNGLIGSGAVYINAGATLNFNVNASNVIYGTSNTFTGGGTFQKTGAGGLTWGGGVANFSLGAGSLIDVQNGILTGASSANDVWSSNKSSLYVAGGATFAGVEGNIMVDALNGAGTVTSGFPGFAYGLTVGVNGGGGIFSGSIQDANGVSAKLTKTGAGTQILTGNNTYTGITTISDGTLQIGNAGTTGNLGTGAVTLSGNSNLNFVRTVDTTISNAISGTGNVSANITTNAGTAGKLTVDSSNFNLDKGSTGVSGLIDLRADGDVTLNTPIVTNNATANAIKVVAGQALNVGDSSGGNVKITGTGNITVGTGGVAAIYSGSILGTTGTSVMVPSGSGKFRYNSDESTANYSKALNARSGTDTGINIIYREAPEIQVTANSTAAGTLTYNGTVRANPNPGVTNNSAVAGVLKNGDSTSLTGTVVLAYAKGLETVLKNAGTYTVKASGLSNELGYKVKYVDGSLVIDQANLVLSGSRAYDGTSKVAGSTLIATGVGSTPETFAVTGAGDNSNLSSKNASTNGGANTLSTLTGLSLGTSGNGGDANNYNTLSASSSTYTVNKADFVLSGSRAYDGTTKVAGSTLIATGVGSTPETFAVTGAGDNSNLSSKNASTNGGANTLSTLTGLSLGTSSNGGDAGNYNGLSLTVATYAVNKAELGSINGRKTYDGKSAVLIAGISDGTLTLTGLNNESATLNTGQSVVLASANAGVTRVASLTGSSFTSSNGFDLNNYVLSDSSVQALVPANNAVNIARATVTATIDAITTTYGTNAATGGVNLIGVIDSDQVNPNGASLTSGVFSSSGNLKAGTYVQSVGGGLGGADAGNYTFNGTSSANYVVNKLALNTQIAGVTTTYGTAAATGAASVSGALSGDKVDLGNAKATLVNAANSSSGNLKAGIYQQTVANSLSGDDAANYTAAPTSLANYVVTPKAIAATVTAADKVYDGNNVATLNANSAGILTGDVVNVLGATGTFASKNVARDGAGNVVAQTVTVTGTGVGLGGTDGANYTLTNATSIASTTARITPKELSVTGITASDKVYDGNTAAAINTANAVVSGLVAGDSVSVSTQSGVGNLASKDVAFDGAGAVASQAVTVSGLSLNGAAAGNYNVSDKSGATAKVLQRALSITGSVAQDKTVDGNTNAQVKPGQLVNLVAGESLVVSATGQFADAEIGTNKAVATQYALANGANGIAKNYTLASEVLRAAILVASINPVQPIVNPSRTAGGGRVVVAGSGNSGAALGVAEGSAEEEVISREECSVLNPEKCECQESTIAGVEMCFAPTLAANSKN